MSAEFALADSEQGEALAAASQRLRAHEDNSPLAVVEFDPSFRIICWSAGAERIFGWRSDEVVGKRIGDLRWVYEPDADRVASLSADMLAGRRLQNVHANRNWRKDGTLIHCEWYNSALLGRDGALVSVRSLVLDVTARRQAEALRDEQSRLLELVASGRPLRQCLEELTLSVGRLQPGVRGAVLLADATGGDVGGVFAAALPRAFAARLEGAPIPSGGSATLCGAEAACRDIAADTEAAPSWRELLTAEGIRACYCCPVPTRAGAARSWFYLLFAEPREPTEWELRIAELGIHIARIVIERHDAERALRESEAQLKEAARRKDEFLAILGHELRNPLAPLRFGLELLRRAGDSAASVAKIRPMLERQVALMSRLIDDLLDVSRITAGKIALKREPTSLGELVRNAVETNRAAIEARGIALAVSLSDPSCLLDVDPARFGQVVSNVLHNAAKFTDPGGHIEIRSEIVRGAVGPRLRLRVIDDGQGISPAMLSRVFDLFLQDAPETRRSEGGLGIGLALAKQLIEMQGGTISAHSAGPGSGCEFTIEAPLAGPLLAAPGPTSAPTPAPPPASAPMRRVAIVDDNRDAAETLAMLVRSLGAEARCTYDGAGALELIEAFRPDVVFLDIGLPGMSGYEVCQRVRATAPNGGPFCVAITGWAQPRDRQRAAEAGFDSHLTKPPEPGAIARILAESAAKRS